MERSRLFYHDIALVIVALLSQWRKRCFSDMWQLYAWQSGYDPSVPT